MYICVYVMYVHTHIVDKMQNLFLQKQTLYTLQILWASVNLKSSMQLKQFNLDLNNWKSSFNKKLSAVL
jgi:hypothetical protein